MVEEDAVRDVHAVALAVVHGHPVAVDLGDRVGRAGVEGRPLRLRRLLHEPEHLRAARLVDPGVEPEVAHRVEHAQDADRGDVRRVLRHVERDLHVALGGEVVDLVRLERLESAREAVLVDQVAVVQDELVPDVVDPPGVEGAAAAHEPVHLVALLEQQLREVAAVLARDPGDERFLRCQFDPPQTPESTPWLARRSKPDRGLLKGDGELGRKRKRDSTLPGRGLASSRRAPRVPGWSSLQTPPGSRGAASNRCGVSAEEAIPPSSSPTARSGPGYRPIPYPAPLESLVSIGNSQGRGRDAALYATPYYRRSQRSSGCHGSCDLDQIQPRMPSKSNHAGGPQRMRLPRAGSQFMSTRIRSQLLGTQTNVRGSERSHARLQSTTDASRADILAGMARRRTSPPAPQRRRPTTRISGEAAI